MLRNGTARTATVTGRPVAGGMDDPRFVFWRFFEPGVASFGLAGVITEIGLAVFGADFAALQPDDRRRAVQNLLAAHRLLLIWDSF